MKMMNYIKKCCGAALLIAAISAVTLNSCSEKIDESSLYTFTGEMMTDHFENNPETFSSYLTILSRVHLSKRSSSTLKELLDARGNYTCFAPTNEAITLYIDSLLKIGQVSSTDINELPDSVAEDIVFNSIIENGNDEAFQTTSFSNNEPLSLTNMNGRYITPSYGNDDANNTIIYININSKIIDGDIEVENGYIHTVDHVLSPSKASIAEMIIGTDNMQKFGEMLSLTGWDEKINKFKDAEWEEKHYDKLGTKVQAEYYTGSDRYAGLFPDKRNYGYTVFVETDDVFEANGITDIPSLKEYIREHNNFDDETNQGNKTSWEDDYENDYNWLNQFVAYHILPEKLTTRTMVTFANEYGVTPTTRKNEQSTGKTSFNVNVWEYWETMGVQRRSMKITGCRIAGEVQRRINRKSEYRQSDYRELNSSVNIPGILIKEDNEGRPMEARNGFYYPIDGILLWNLDVPTKVLNERMRYDVTSLFPELLTNEIRQNRIDSWFFPNDYFDNIYEATSETELEYMPNTGWAGGDGSWVDYQMDEFNIRGKVDFTMKLPPVPYTGTYELRYGVWTSDRRGMVQVYIGKNPRNLPAIGVPLDLRFTGVNVDLTGWVSEDQITATVGDSTALYENQKTMRNMGFMKGPKYIYRDTGHTARDISGHVRKIIFTGTLEAGATYWIRFKSVLDDPKKEFFYDYIELVPKAIYAGEYNEDIW